MMDSSKESYNFDQDFYSVDVTDDLNESWAIDVAPDEKKSTLQGKVESIEDIDNQENKSEDNVCCAYCGISDLNCLVQCKQCLKWFCNGKGGNVTASHIVHHLVKSKHHAVRLHPNAELGIIDLECYQCSVENIFTLGYVPSKTEDVVAILCRHNCIHTFDTSNSDWDFDAWTPLIQSNKELLNWIAHVPTEQQILAAKAVTPQLLSQLEELWLKNPHAKGNEQDSGPKIQSVLLQYSTAELYRDIMLPLIKIEGEYDRRLKESQAKSNIPIRWEKISKGYRGTFHFYFEVELRLIPGDELKIKYFDDEGTEKVADGYVIAINSDDEIVADFPGFNEAQDSQKYSVELIWKAISFERMTKALKRFASSKNECMASYLKAKILGNPLSDAEKKAQLKDFGTVPAIEEVNAPSLPLLDHSQAHAVQIALSQPLSLIQGPPGTGKTVTSATIIYHIVNRLNSQKHKNKEKNRKKILVCAPSNVAADQLASKINATGVVVVRVCARSREGIPCSVDFLTLHSIIQYKALKNEEYQKLIQKRDEGIILTKKQQNTINRLRFNFEREVLLSADVIVTTCVASGDPRFAKMEFHTVLIDESTQATEPETLIPITLKAKQVILVGDHCQLGPVIMCKPAASAGFTQSLFERLVLLGVRPIRLEVQYRMHPALSTFPSATFYEGTLQDGVSAEERTLPQMKFPWPVANRPFMFYSSNGYEELSATGTSFINRMEAEIVAKVVHKFLSCGVHPENIGIITPYEGQRAYIVQHLMRQGVLQQNLYRRLEVSSVDSFQGREKEFIILSCVRSNETSIIGFLKDPRRLNVALTRARYGLVVVGNPNVLATQPLWHELLQHSINQQVLVEGTLGDLKPVEIQLPNIKIGERFYGGALAAQVTALSVHKRGLANITISNVYPYLVNTQQRSSSSKRYNVDLEIDEEVDEYRLEELNREKEQFVE
eukprot:TRINITY_DN3050_c0_g1_i1.p1 TRINITY_DN3050_c0_g1~~TRINITY_DN3050_c0_g1_i1.p1  ORF type:complete len:949 (-),score=282.10 TRINITY_DN3050_c0_g1_i1:193-3039(-)